MKTADALSKKELNYRNETMSQTLIRMAQLATYPNRPGKLPFTKSTIWKWVKDGKFPAPFKVHGATVWDVAEVDAFIAQMAGARA